MDIEETQIVRAHEPDSRWQCLSNVRAKKLSEWLDVVYRPWAQEQYARDRQRLPPFQSTIEIIGVLRQEEGFITLEARRIASV